MKWLTKVSGFFAIFTLPIQGIALENLDVDLEKIKVRSFYGTYDVSEKQPGVPVPSLGKPVDEWWQPPEKADRPYNIAVLFPHLKDPYWVAVNYGMVLQSKKYGVGMQLWHAGGYRNLGKQTIQLQHILKNKNTYDGVIIGAVQFSKPKLEIMYEKLHQAGIPVISLVNDSYTPTTKGKAMISWKDMGYQAGKFLVEHSKGKKIKVLFFVGARGTGWAPDSQAGFNEALEEFDPDQNITVLPPIWGDTGYKAQRHLVNFILPKYKNVDYFVGNGIAAHAMISEGPNGETAPIDKFKKEHPNIKIISTYIIQEIYDDILSGKVLAAPTDLMKQQGMMAIDMMIKYLNGERPGNQGSGFPFRSGPIVPIIHKDNIHDWSFEKLFGSRNFKPVFKVEPGF